MRRGKQRIVVDDLERLRQAVEPAPAMDDGQPQAEQTRDLTFIVIAPAECQ